MSLLRTPSRDPALRENHTQGNTLTSQEPGKQEIFRPTYSGSEENGQLVLVDRFELETWEKKIRGFVTQKAELDKEVAAKNKEAELANALAKRLEERLRLATIEVSNLNGQAAIADDKFKQVLREKTALVAQNAALTKKLGDLKQRHDQLDIELQKARMKEETMSKNGSLRATPVKTSVAPTLVARQAHDNQRKDAEIQQLKAERQRFEERLKEASLAQAHTAKEGDHKLQQQAEEMQGLHQAQENEELRSKLLALEGAFGRQADEYQAERKSMEQRARHMKASWEKGEEIYRQELSKLSNQLTTLQSKLDSRDFSEFDDSVVFEPKDDLLSPLSSDDEDIEAFNQQIRYRVGAFQEYQQEKGKQKETEKDTASSSSSATPLLPSQPVTAPAPAPAPTPTKVVSSVAVPNNNKKPTAESRPTPKAAENNKAKPHVSTPRKIPAAENLHKALFDYNGKVFEGKNLAFKKGDLIIVTGEDEEGWWKGYLKGEEPTTAGYFPGTFVRKA